MNYSHERGYYVKETDRQMIDRIIKANQDYWKRLIMQAPINNEHSDKMYLAYAEWILNNLCPNS